MRARDGEPAGDRVRQRMEGFTPVVMAFLASRLALAFIGWAAAVRIPGGRPARPWPMPEAPLLFTIWARWDAQWYLQIAAHGYHISSGRFTPHAFFPLYPLLLAASERLTGLPAVVLGVLWSQALFLGALLLLYRLVSQWFGEAIARRAALYLVLFPTSFYFSAVYTESLFLFLAVAAFLAAERDRWWWAGLAGMGAALTRNVGVSLLVPLGWMAWEKWSSSPPAPGRRIGATGWGGRLFPLLLVPAGLGLWCGYLALTTGDPLRWLHAESAWGRRLSPPWAGLVAAVERILSAPDPPAQEALTAGRYVHAWRPQFGPLYSLIDAGAAVSWLVLAGLGRRAGLRWPYIAYTLIGVLIPLSAPTIRSMTPLASMSRYVAVLFPAFVVLARLADRHPWVDPAITASFPAIQALFFILFTTWNWIA